MTDLEMTLLCAKAMSYIEEVESSISNYIEIRDDELDDWRQYNPLHDDAQAMALVREFLYVLEQTDDGCWTVRGPDQYAVSKNLNRAIVQCVAQMEFAKEKANV